LTTPVLLLLIASLRHKSATILASGLSGLFIGLFALTWLSILIWIAILIISLAGWIAAGLRFIFAAILSFLFWAPVFYTILSLTGFLVLLVLVSGVRGISFIEFLTNLKEWLRNLTAKPVVMLLGVLALAALIWFVGIPLWTYYIDPILVMIRDWLTQYVVPILSWIGSAIFSLVLTLIVILLIAGTLLVLGWQFAEQFSTARFCGQNTHTLFEASFAIGAVMGPGISCLFSKPQLRRAG
jgi:hypothetical protein